MQPQFTLFDEPKRCSRCGETKPRSEFHRNKRQHDGLHNTCKVCRAEYKRPASERDKETSRKWYERNREKHLESSRANYQANREKRLEQTRQWRIANLDLVRENNRQWYLRNYERRTKQIKQWAKANPESIRDAGRRWRAARLEAPGDGMTWPELIDAHGPSCYLCKQAKANSIDHVVPLSRGGTNYSENLRPACRPCNSAKNNRTYEEYLEYLEGVNACASKQKKAKLC